MAKKVFSLFFICLIIAVSIPLFQSDISNQIKKPFVLRALEPYYFSSDHLIPTYPVYTENGINEYHVENFILYQERDSIRTDNFYDGGSYPYGFGDPDNPDAYHNDRLPTREDAIDLAKFYFSHDPVLESKSITDETYAPAELYYFKQEKIWVVSFQRKLATEWSYHLRDGEQVLMYKDLYGDYSYLTWYIALSATTGEVIETWFY